MGNVVGPLWSDCSALTRIVVVGYPTLNVLLMLLSQWPDMQFLAMYGFYCNLVTVVKHYCIWTLFTGAFYRPFSGGGGMSGGFAFLMMLFELYMALMTFPQREREQGSTTFLCWLLLMQGFISAVFLLINYLLTFTSPENSVGYWMAPNTGLWPILLLTLTLRSLATPDGSTNFWGVMQIPNKWYPLFLGAFFCLMGGFQWNIVVAVAMGYGYPYLRLERALPSRMWANSCEQRCCGRGRSCLGAYWVRAADTAGYELESGDRRYATLSDFGRSNQAQQANRSSNTTSSSGQGGSTANANFIAFSGSGNRLGEGEADSIVPQHSEPAAAQQEEQELPNTAAPTAVSADTELINQS